MTSISVVIATYNRASLLGATLDQLTGASNLATKSSLWITAAAMRRRK